MAQHNGQRVYEHPGGSPTLYPWARAHIGCRSLRQGVDGGLRSRRVGLKPRGAVVQRHADVDDAGGSRFPEGGKRRRAHVEHPHRVNLHHRPKALRGEWVGGWVDGRPRAGRLYKTDTK